MGGEETIQVDVRVISATHRDLKKEVEAGPLPRGSVLPAARGPLRGAAAARAARGHPAAGQPLHRQARPPHQRRRSTASTTRRWPGCATHHWPGNVRELENAVEQALVFASGSKHRRRRAAGRSCARGLAENTLAVPSGDKSLPEILEDLERQLIQRAYDKTGGREDRDRPAAGHQDQRAVLQAGEIRHRGHRRPGQRQRCGGADGEPAAGEGGADGGRRPVSAQQADAAVHRRGDAGPPARARATPSAPTRLAALLDDFAARPVPGRDPGAARAPPPREELQRCTPRGYVAALRRAGRAAGAAGSRHRGVAAQLGGGAAGRRGGRGRGRGGGGGPGANAFVWARPPGHHAEQAQAMGFCLFNNVAIAAERARRLGAERVLIIDWDVHHGNGTQHSFEQPPGRAVHVLAPVPVLPGHRRARPRSGGARGAASPSTAGCRRGSGTPTSGRSGTTCSCPSPAPSGPTWCWCRPASTRTPAIPWRRCGSPSGASPPCAPPPRQLAEQSCGGPAGAGAGGRLRPDGAARLEPAPACRCWPAPARASPSGSAARRGRPWPPAARRWPPFWRLP